MSAPQTEVLIAVDGTQIAAYLFGPGEYVIGRNPDCHICVEADLVSRRHAKLTLNFENTFIEDLGSSNGTRVNGKRIAGTERLWPNQKVQLGTATISLRRLQGGIPDEMSLAPSQFALRSMLPPEILREKKYDIGAVLARGGMGQILDVREAAIERKVAMKVMLDTNDAGGIARFIAEAKVTGQLEHPNIVPVHELGLDENGQPFFTMKMVHGITLRRVLDDLARGDGATVKGYPVPTLLTIFQKVCDAVAFAHSKRVIHRDLKPENIMLGDYGEVLVMDWGLAKVLGGTPTVVSPGPTAGAAPPSKRSSIHTVPIEMSGATLSGAVMGTPQYMAPEQARGEVETMDHRADIYGLGAILYHILALRPSVAGKDAWDVISKVARGEIEPLDCGSPLPLSPSAAGDEQVPGQKRQRTGALQKRARSARSTSHLPGGHIPDSLAAVVRKAMALDRTARYPHVADLQRDIMAYQNGFATSAENAGLGKHILLALKRNKAVSIATAVALVLLAVGGSIAFVRIAAERTRVKAALVRLTATAPTFAAHARAQLEEQKPTEALQTIDDALLLDPRNAEYHLLRGHLLAVLMRLDEAEAAYDRAAPGDSAEGNRDLCATLRGQYGDYPDPGGPAAHSLWQQAQAEARNAEARYLSTRIQLDSAKLLATWREYLGSLGYDPKCLELTTGKQLSLTFRKVPVTDLNTLARIPFTELILESTKVSDLSPLRGKPLVGLSIVARGADLKGLAPLAGMPLQKLRLTGRIPDLTPIYNAPLRALEISEEQNPPSRRDWSFLRGLPLQELAFTNCSIDRLDFISGMQLQTFRLTSCPITDLSPLRGQPIKTIGLKQLPVRDLSPIIEAPLEDVNIQSLPLESLEWLKGKQMKRCDLRSLRLRNIEFLRGSPVITCRIQLGHPVDVSALADCPLLRELLLDEQCTGYERLRNHPGLKLISFREAPVTALPAQTAAEFWKEYDAKQAAGKK